jgi:hypothetical protein
LDRAVHTLHDGRLQGSNVQVGGARCFTAAHSRGSLHTQPAVPPEIEAEFGEQLAKLASFGYTASGSLYSSELFGNWFVDLAGPVTFRIVKDRSQYFVDGDRESVAEY